MLLTVSPPRCVMMIESWDIFCLALYEIYLAICKYLERNWNLTILLMCELMPSTLMPRIFTRCNSVDFNTQFIVVIPLGLLIWAKNTFPPLFDKMIWPKWFHNIIMMTGKKKGSRGKLFGWLSFFLWLTWKVLWKWSHITYEKVWAGWLNALHTNVYVLSVGTFKYANFTNEYLHVSCQKCDRNCLHKCL